MSNSVLVIGSQQLQSLESSYARAFKELGWTVQFWDPVASLHREVRGQRLGRLFSDFVHVEPWARKANIELLQLVDKMQPTLLLIIATGGVRAGTLAQIKVRAPKSQIYCVYPDSPHNLDSERIHCLPFCDRVTTSSPAWVEAFQKMGAEYVDYLPFAADTELHKPASLLPAQAPAYVKSHDVAFIGTWRPEREEFLEQLADFDLCVWGSDYWQKRTRPHSPLRARWGRRSLTGSEFAYACANNRIMLNIMDCVTWPGPNMRVFEQAACRAFSLTTRSPSISQLFREGETIECFDSIEEARDKIHFYLKHEDKRQRIADAAYEFVIKRGHTYRDRARQLELWVQTRVGELSSA